MQFCEKNDCPCFSIAESIDETKKYRKIKAELDDEEHVLMMQQKQIDDNASQGNLSQDGSRFFESGIKN